MAIQLNVSRTTADRFSRLKALQPPSTLPLSGNEVGPLRNPVEEESFGCASGVTTGSERLALILGASVKRNGHGEHLSLHCWHGDHAPCAPDAAALRLLAPDAPQEVADAQQWLFLDTETTGLAGGTGTYPFLVGLAWWEGGGLEVEQLFMREYSEERSLLAALAERLAERPVLVTFNGKSFDWPLLETRYPDDADHSSAGAAGSPRFPSSRTESLASAAGLGKIVATRTSRARVEPGR